MWELLYIINHINSTQLNPEHIVFENWWHFVHDLRNTGLCDYEIKMRLGTMDRKPLYLVQFQK